MNTQALNEMADYLDRGEFGGREFNMGAFDTCVIGQAAARELRQAGKPATIESVGVAIDGLAIRVFGIKQSEQREEWSFAFGAQWGDDPKAAAYRLRDLARNKKAPPRELWDQYTESTGNQSGIGCRVRTFAVFLLFLLWGPAVLAYAIWQQLRK